MLSSYSYFSRSAPECTRSHHLKPKNWKVPGGGPLDPPQREGDTPSHTLPYSAASLPHWSISAVFFFFWNPPPTSLISKWREGQLTKALAFFPLLPTTGATAGCVLQLMKMTEKHHGCSPVVAVEPQSGCTRPVCRGGLMRNKKETVQQKSPVLSVIRSTSLSFQNMVSLMRIFSPSAWARLTFTIFQLLW